MLILYLITILISGAIAFICGYRKKKKEIDEYNREVIRFYRNYEAMKRPGE